ncbi:fused response regulator/phosphatase [Dactylosporangium sp. AC04546]|uniref:PP2C family protein-serine/threonine phosphatase n=1 Tax=Dactylosporangium sp. AC04546 TaxID=2862460 RepID=UPI001EDD4405|nr:fused response regulator/phosphatase [Dactylosporangium sp. AC04546]WVK84966.1 fused response regulator/phosphatase [Dactylosporangium sp. AC04546]
MADVGTTVDPRKQRIGPFAGERIRVLLVEDDPGDAFLVRELLAEADAPFDVEIAQTMREARPRFAGVQCVLLDLGLPDASGLDGLRQVLVSAEGTAVCVLTGLEDEHLGIAAVAEGAQDYLVKGSVDGAGLSRAVRYAVERKRADENARLLRESELRQAESARLEWGLLPKPLMDGVSADLFSIYRPGRDRALLGGDFFDAIGVDRGARLHLLIGDVCGHGVDEAPLGVALRVAWRALVLAGVPEEQILPSLEQVLVSERRSDELFATVAVATVDLAAGSARIRLAGHPPPIVLGGGRAEPVDVDPGLVLGVMPGLDRPASEVALGPPGWSLLLYTDGLIEGAAGPDADAGERLGVDGLCRVLERPSRVLAPELPAWLAQQAEAHNGGPVSDDIAVLLLSPRTR